MNFIMRIILSMCCALSRINTARGPMLGLGRGAPLLQLSTALYYICDVLRKMYRKGFHSKCSSSNIKFLLKMAI